MAIGTPNVGTYTERSAETSTNVPYPTTVNAGDMLYMLAAINSTSTTAITLPTGWTQLDQHVTAGGVGPDVFVARMVAAGTEGGTTVAVAHVSQPSNWQIVGFSGVDTTTPEDVAVSSQATNSASLTQTIPGVTTVTAGTTLLYVAALNSTTGNATPATGFTETGDRVSGSRAMEVAYQQGVSAGATGNVVITWTVSAKSVGVLVAIRPVVSASYTGTAAPTLTIGTTSAARLGLRGAAAKTVTISTTSAARLGRFGATAKTLTLSTTSTGTRGKTAAAAPVLTLAATSAGIVVSGLGGAAAKALTISTASAARLGLTGAATRTLTIGTTSAGTKGKTGAAAAALTIATTSAGTVTSSSGPAIRMADGTVLINPRYADGSKTLIVRGWLDADGTTIHPFA